MTNLTCAGRTDRSARVRYPVRVEEVTGTALSQSRDAVTPRRLWAFVGTALAVVAVDQASKALVRSWLAEGHTWPHGARLIRLAHVENAGAAFGILQGAGPFLIVTTVIGVVTIVAYLWFAPVNSRLFTLGLGLVLGGALGNFIDRVARGTVTDFIDPARYPAFNLADSAIVLGVATLFLMSLTSLPDDEADEDGP